MTDQDQEVDLRHLWGVLRRRSWIIVVLVVLASAAAFLMARRSPNVYEATATVRITNPNSENVFSNAAVAVDPKRLVDTEIEVIKSATIRIAVNRKLADQAMNIDKLTVANPAGTDLLQISVASESAELAASAANTFADVYVATRKAQSVNDLDARAKELRRNADEIGQKVVTIDGQLTNRTGPEGDALRSQRSALVTQQADFNNRANQFEVEAGLRSGNVQVVDQAQAPAASVSPKPMRDAALGAVLALLLGIGIVFLLDHLDDRITSPDDLEKITGGVSVFGSIPIFTPDKKRGAHKMPHGPRTLVPLSSIDAEVYRTLRSNLRFSCLDESKSVIMVTSPSGGEGKTTVAANLAVSLAESGMRVVVVSADLRRPMIASLFGVKETDKGLTSVLLGDELVTDCLVPITLGSGHRLYMLPSGPLPANPAEVLGSRGMGDLLAGLARAEVDFVLVDCAPVLPVSDPLALAQFVDGIIMISVAGQTRGHHLTEACERLERVGANVIGVILNGVPTARGHYPHYYRGYGQYGDDDTQTNPSPLNSEGNLV